MSDTVKSVVFAAVLCVVCSTLLTAASTGLEIRQQKNILVDRQKNILKSVGLVAEGRKNTPEEIKRLYTENIIKYEVDAQGRIREEDSKEKKTDSIYMPIYIYQKKDGIVKAYIIPIHTKGLWGKILGYLAIESDGTTISGFTVYSHSETPGLGGEIEQSWFQNNFVGKKIVDFGGSFVSVSVAKGKVADKIPQKQQANYVDGISGATLTSKLLSKGLMDILADYESVSIQFRNKKKYCEINRNNPWCGYEKKE